MKNNYNIHTDIYKNLKNKFSIPSYQRKLVWSMTQKKEFINSILQGYPFGSILVFTYDNEHMYSLIDGLQRISTLKEFEKDPSIYLEDIFQEYSDEIIDGCIEFVQERTKLKLKIINILKNIFSDHTYTDEKLLSIFLDELKNIHPDFAQNENYITKFFYNKKYNFKTKYDLSNLVIPYIEFVGSVSELAEVFEKLNRGGVKLTKYQVFAAQFSKYNLYLNNDKYNKQILTHIIERYKYLNEERSIQIEEFDEEFFYENKKINLAELCYAIGMLIIDNSEVFLFNYKNKKKSEYEDLANELGFSVMGVLTRVPNNQLSEIYKHCEKLEAEDIEEFSKKIVDIFKEINNLFKDILEIKKGKYIVDFLPSQYLSFFSTLWVIKYEKIERFKFKNRSRYSNEYNNTKNNLKYYYMIDKIKKLWGNGAVNYLNNIYFKPILKDDFEAVLYDWFDETLEQDSEKIIPHTKLILIYYYNTKNMDGTKFKNKMDNYDFEHIIPKEKLKKIKKLTEMKTNFPGGSIGNIGLLSTNENRGKKSDTVYFTIKDKESIGTISEVLDKLNYPTKAELDFVHSPYTEKTIKEARQLVKIRGRDIITTLVNNLYT